MSASLRHSLRNALQTGGLVLGMAGLMGLAGWLLAGAPGVWWAAGLTALALLLTPRVSPRFVLRLYNARPLSRGEAPGLYGIAEALARRAGLSRVPWLFYIPSPVANAFTVGSRQAPAMALTDGLLRSLNTRELAAVLAHETAHAANGDLALMNLADVISRVTAALSMTGQFLLALNLPLLLLGQAPVSWLLVLVLVFAPGVSSLLQLALSRTREFSADAEAARLTGDPLAMASALGKMEAARSGFLARLLLPGHRSPHPSLLRTHPAHAERIARLRDLAQDQARHVEAAPVVLPFPPPAGRPRWRIGGFWR
ncbi:MAG: zinc metalloprotease HtpX [Thermodesulfobacteriota bacterium]